MGMIRVFLALSVVLAHIGHERAFGAVSGKYAVEMFFAISGFYMATVLPKYLALNNGTLTFYKARYLRLYPAYLVVFIVFILFFRPITDISAHAPIAQLYTYFVSFSMLGYESLNWVQFDKASKAIQFVASTKIPPGRSYTLDLIRRELGCYVVLSYTAVRNFSAKQFSASTSPANSNRRATTPLSDFFGGFRRMSVFFSSD